MIGELKIQVTDNRTDKNRTKTFLIIFNYVYIVIQHKNNNNI